MRLKAAVSELAEQYWRLRSMCGQTAQRCLFLEQTEFRIPVTGTPSPKIVVARRNHNFIGRRLGSVVYSTSEYISEFFY